MLKGGVIKCSCNFLGGSSKCSCLFTKGEGGVKNVQNLVHVVCECPHSIGKSTATAMGGVMDHPIVLGTLEVVFQTNFDSSRRFFGRCLWVQGYMGPLVNSSFSIRLYGICIARRISHELVLEAAPNKNIGWRRDNFRRRWISSYCAIYLPNYSNWVWTSKEEEMVA